uniref:Uncharacterized LOC100183291 n=1 Tax=Ciona intestinalis TaxID=7719 RepID=F7A2M7_CIOIN|nr:uncharacterized protein LOC100183291 [Ciona intestinalis]|eukprot:XP_002127551.1 uncharacterized protein LOC100183291 [Ciona intestinalis]
MGGCSLPNCTGNNRKGDRLFVFPVNAERRKVWIDNCRIEHWGWTPTFKSRLCEHHFSSEQYEQHRADGFKKLKPNAIPTLFQFNSNSEELQLRNKFTNKKKKRRALQKIKTESMNSGNRLNYITVNKVQRFDHSYGKEVKTKQNENGETNNETAETINSSLELEIDKCEVIVDCEQCHKLYLEIEEMRKQLLYTEQKLDKMEIKFLALLAQKQTES